MPDTKLSTAATMILTSLAEADRHGYAIRKDVARKTRDEVELGVTTLYRVLALLLDDRLVEECDGPDPDRDDERRRYYRITAAGRRALAAEVRRLERVLAAARAAASPARPR